MEDIWVYDWDFNLLHIEARPISSNWTVHYNDIGTWEGHFDAESGIVPVAMSHPYLVIVQGALQAVVTSKQVGSECVLYGRTVNWLLSGGVLPDFDGMKGDVETLARGFVAQVLPWMELGEVFGFTKQITFWRNTYNPLSDVVRECLANDGGGHRVVFDPANHAWVFSVYRGVKQSIVLTEYNNNVYDTQYTEDMLEAYTGGWYQEEQPEAEDGTRPDPIWKYLVRQEQTGVYRRDKVLSATTRSEAESELKESVRTDTVQAKTRGLAFGIDYGLGDIVTVQKQMGAWRAVQLGQVTGVNIWWQAGDCGEQPILEEWEEEE